MPSLLQILPMLLQLLQMVAALSQGAGTGNSGGAFQGALSPSPTQPDSTGGIPSQAPAPAPSPALAGQNPQTPKAADANPPAPSAGNSGEADSSPAKTSPTEGVSNAQPGMQPPNSISVKELGAKGDGSTDDQAAIQKAVDQAKGSGKSVWFPPGTYNHSGVITLDGTKLSGSGDQTVLRATNPEQASIKLTGDGSALSNIKTVVSAPGRSSQPDAAAVLVQNASNASVSNLNVQGASSNGIRLDNASGSKISNNLVQGTNADGIALMNGSSNNSISHNVVRQAGDDSFSDDSYNGDAKQDRNNAFDGNMSLDNAYGRGIVLAGSANDKVTNNVVSGSKWYGIFAESDPNSGTMQSSGHSIQNNTVINNPNGAPVQANGMNVSGTRTTGSAPNIADILGWNPGQLVDRGMLTRYVPGTGSGANNAGGNRS